MWLPPAWRWPRKRRPSVEPAGDDTIATLITQLAADDFAQREFASQQLAELGRAAIPALEAATHEPNLEVRRRSERIIAMIGERAYDDAIAAFEADLDGSQNTTLPGFQRAAERIGSGSQARKLYSRLYRAEPRIFETYDDDPQKTAARFVSRTEVHTQRFRGSNSWRRVRNGQTPDHTINAMALLLVGSDERLEIPDPTINDFNTFLRTALPYKRFNDFSEQDFLNAWLSKWITTRSTQPSLEYANMHLGLSYEIPATVDVAARILKRDDRETTSYRPLAMICVGKFGDESHLPLLEGLLQDTSRVYAGQGRNADNRQISYEVQVRDIALAMLLHLTGQELSDYGFENARTHPMQLYHQNSLFFASDEARAAGFEKWRAFRSARENVDASPAAAPDASES